MQPRQPAARRSYRLKFSATRRRFRAPRPARHPHQRPSHRYADACAAQRLAWRDRHMQEGEAHPPDIIRRRREPLVRQPSLTLYSRAHRTNRHAPIHLPRLPRQTLNPRLCAGTHPVCPGLQGTAGVSLCCSSEHRMDTISTSFTPDLIEALRAPFPWDVLEVRPGRQHRCPPRSRQRREPRWSTPSSAPAWRTSTGRAHSLIILLPGRSPA